MKDVKDVRIYMFLFFYESIERKDGSELERLSVVCYLTCNGDIASKIPMTGRHMDEGGETLTMNPVPNVSKPVVILCNGTHSEECSKGHWRT